ncbi:MAG: hypothetical protein ACLFNV_12090 [Desulfovibrionales bacterium]
MAFNPFGERGLPLEQQIQNWTELNVKPYDKNEVHPYTRCRAIVMNGAEIESVYFGHQFARHVQDPELKKNLAMVRRIEAQQQKMVNWMIPANESVLENTIGYEQVAVDLTAGLAQMEPDPYVKAAFDFALLEDFDHLYRYADLLEMTEGVKAERLVGDLTEIIPGRPTVAEHRHPFDEVRKPFDASSADIQTMLNCNIIVAAEQQTMNFYMNVGNRADTMLGRGLYQEIAMVEEQHVTHYESLIDPTQSWFMRNVMHHYTEAYLYWCFMNDEVDRNIKIHWERHLDMEIGHLKAAAEIMKKHEGKDPEESLPNSFPDPFVFRSNVDYVRNILAEQTDWSADGTNFLPVTDLPENHRYFHHQERVNRGPVPSQEVIREHIDKTGRDYRLELGGEHPVERFRQKEEVTA